MSETSLIGKAKELAVASQLVRMGIHVFMPLVDNGIDLIAASSDGAVLVPVQVKYKATRTGFSLDAKKAAGYPKTTVLAFGAEGHDQRAELETFHFFPVLDWLHEAEKHATGREDGKLVVYSGKSDREWIVNHRGDRGIRGAFAAIFEANERSA
ncbi:hypothetical protein PE066_19020 [Ramlibacter tataouinensis]|uniref:hypothetical protein n=1 Tax=Ramlibacter tataouinensis TaxID=94132 RepID=UPI0022F381FB|nr:hypothetical protein [Ramlibacter tataouinensis]WBY01530.1 hypothetical protein PE066_19020 [Ramlibacter tataouinensis]